MSIGGPTDHPAAAKAEVKPAAPEKISQKHITLNKRIEETSDTHEAGQAGRSRPKLRELKLPRRVSSIRTISSGLDEGVTICTSVPESSLSDKLPTGGCSTGISKTGREAGSRESDLPTKPK
jgi:hypothetical protein